MHDGGDGPKSAATAYTRECPGYHVFDLFASDYDCVSRAHYGNVHSYIRYRVSDRGAEARAPGEGPCCAAALPAASDRHPRNPNAGSPAPPDQLNAPYGIGHNF